MDHSSKIILSGDRTTGPLHLGHYLGSLRARVSLQNEHRQFLLLADAQAMTDNAANPAKISAHVLEVALDYLAVGIDPAKSTICVQSALPALFEMSSLFLNLVTVARLERNPTVKQEIQLRGFERDIPAGFLCYPVAQAADITAFRASLVPVGEDQLPMIEQTNEIVRRVNRIAGAKVLVEAEAVMSAVPRLPGTDGKAKMSKSQGNAIALGASAQEIKQAVHSMYTDPDHLRICDPGKVEGNVVFMYLDIFDADKAEVAELKAAYQKGGLGDMVLKQRLVRCLNELLEPIRERRAMWARDLDTVRDVLREGSFAARSHTQQTLDELKGTMKMYRI